MRKSFQRTSILLHAILVIENEKSFITAPTRAYYLVPRMDSPDYLDSILDTSMKLMLLSVSGLPQYGKESRMALNMLKKKVV